MKTRSVFMLFLALVAGCSRAPDSNSPLATTPSEQEATYAGAESDAVLVTGTVSYVLADGEQSHAEHPDTFWVPPREQRETLVVGQIVKLMFEITHVGGEMTERMWVIVKEKTRAGYTGVLDNDPTCTSEMKSGLQVNFQPRHVIQIFEDSDSG